MQHCVYACGPIVATGNSKHVFNRSQDTAKIMKMFKFVVRLSACSNQSGQLLYAIASKMFDHCMAITMSWSPLQHACQAVGRTVDMNANLARGYMC